MKKYDMQITEDNLIDSIEKDYLERNRKLIKLIDILNSFNSNMVISIDGGWGTGKTIFVKQLEVINKRDDIKVLNQDSVKRFKDNYIVFYYNAWENDMHDSPLLSLIYNLINAYPKEKSQTANGKVQLPLNLKELLKSISGNSIDLDKVTTFEDIAAEVFTIEEKREALNNLLTSIIPQNKKLLFIVDELDRCNPCFAVNLLETLKHFFSNDNLVFIVSTNNEQLSYTINKYYGNNFDGYGYLNKFYDLIIELEEINTENYLSRVFCIEKTSQFWNCSLFGIINYFKFNMREINRVLSDFDLLNTYFQTAYGGLYEDDIIAKYIFLPYCLGLKVRNRSELSLFLNGKGLNELIEFVLQDEKITGIVKRETLRLSGQDAVSKEDITEFITKKYNSFFTNVKNNDYNDFSYNKKIFLDTFSLLGDFIRIE